MKYLPLIIGLGLSTGLIHASEVPELKVIELKYDTSKFSQDEALRQTYILKLAALRWQLAREGRDGWKEVDGEIARYPAPAGPDSTAFTQARAGTWYSPRHDYLYRTDGTWTMDPSMNDPHSPHGTWSIQGNQYIDSVATTPPSR